LPAINRKIVASRVLTGGTAVVKQSDLQIEISVPLGQRQEIDTIVALTLDAPAAGAKVVKLASGSLAAGKKAIASNVYQNMTEDYGPQKAFDDDPDTRWATDYGVRKARLEVELGRPQSIRRAYLSEAYAPRVQEFELAARHQGQWKTIHRGRTIGERCTLRFDPVTADAVRLEILKSAEGPTLWELQVFAE
jgi:alpha-L-fucosidase